MIHKERKAQRLKGYDYSKNNYYFVTICTHNREHYFGEIINGEMILNEIGKIVLKKWIDLPNHYSNCLLDEFIVMPNHFHGLILIDNDTKLNLSNESRIIELEDSKNNVRNGSKPFQLPNRLLDNEEDNDTKLNLSNESRVIGLEDSKNNVRNGSKPFQLPNRLLDNEEDNDTKLNLSNESRVIGLEDSKNNVRNGSKPFQVHGLSEIIRSFKTFSSKEINILMKYIFENNNSNVNYNIENNIFSQLGKFQWHKSFHDRIIRNEIELNNVRNYIKTNPLKWHLDVENSLNELDENENNRYYQLIISKV